MKNLKSGNIILIVVVLFIATLYFFGAFNNIFGGLVIVTKSVQERQNLEISNLKDSISNMNVEFKDSIKSLLVYYKSDKFKEASYDTVTTYWFVKHSHKKFKSQNVIKFDGEFSPVDLIHKIHKHDKMVGYVDINILQQVSVKEYYKWLEYEDLTVDYIPY